MTGLGKVVNTIEETIIAMLLAGMTIVTFTQVVARYVFNSGWIAALEFTSILFAWLVLIGA
ncbi:MAG: TRAP transporter small permease subunit, partial [Beijerinckiaceae bacterium]